MTLPPDLTAILLSAASDGITRDNIAAEGMEPVQQILSAIDRCVLGRTLTIRVGAADPLVLDARGRKLICIRAAPAAFPARDLIGQPLDGSPDMCSELIAALEGMCANVGDVTIRQSLLEAAQSIAQGGVSARSLIALLPAASLQEAPKVHIAALRRKNGLWQTGSATNPDLSSAMAAADRILPGATWLAPGEILVLETGSAHAILLFDQGRGAAILCAEAGSPAAMPAKTITASLAAMSRS